VKTKTFFALPLMVLIVFSLMSISPSEAAKVPVLYVFDPVTQSGVAGASVDETFTIDVKIRDVENLVTYDLWLQWNTTLLEFVGASEGPFLNSSGTYRSIFDVKHSGMPGWPFPDKIYVINSQIGQTFLSSASGTGTLVSVTFKVLAEGSGMLDLQDSVLAKYDPFAPPPIIHTSEDGYFTTGPLPRVVVEPAEVLGVLPGENFNVNISAFDVLDVYNLTIAMRWKADLLNATEIVEGSFLSDAGDTDFVSAIDQFSGVLYINNTLTGPPEVEGVSGSGTLATITFTVETRGATDLELSVVKLYKKDGSVSPVAPESSTFSNTLRDVAIIDASLSATSVSRGEKVNITVTVKNNGLENETFTVRVDFAPNQAVEPAKPVGRLVVNTTQTLTFRWDTSDVEPKDYTLKALIVESIPGEDNKGDNTRTIGTVTVLGSGFDFNLILIGGAIAAVVVVALAVFFIKRRK